jgi:REP element-mobilizing transposase RayT
MANTYTQLYVHIIFSPRGRQNLVHTRIKTKVYKYIAGIIKKKGQKLIIINGMPDHIHIFISFSPDIALSDLIGVIKTGSSNFINDNKLVSGHFSWQRGFGAFTYSKSQAQNVINYIKDQEKHHGRKTFKEEYIELLQKFDIDYKEEYLFEWYD